MYKAMFVDDEYMILEGLKHILPWEELGFEIVKTARNAKDALSFLETQPVDLLITDINMPEMTGIQLIESAQQAGLQFFSLILSGYQEFEYVKRGIDLGVKNYLVKPVDKAELLKSVQQIKKLLDEASQLNRQQQVFLEAGLSRWLNDELNESQFDELAKEYNLNEAASFTTVLFEGQQDYLEKTADFLVQQNQRTLIRSWIHQTGQLLWVYGGTRQNLFVILHEIERRDKSSLRVILGETVSEWENLYESYERLRQIQQLQDFYPELVPEMLQTTDFISQPRDELSFLAFNKALMIGDEKTIKAELQQIFDEISARRYPPEYVRYVSFLLFADISRQFPNASQGTYDESIAAIGNSHTIDELFLLLNQVLAGVSQHSRPVVYSDVVTEVIKIVETSYQEELNLKTIAETLHLSVVYLGQLFKKETKRSFSQYLNQVRIKKAQQLLLHSSETISEISEVIGYNNTNYFSKMFKKLNGITPKEFRDQYHADYEALEG